MKLTPILKQLLREIGDPATLKMANVDSAGVGGNPEADSDAQVLLLMNQLGQLPGFIQAVRNLSDPQAKYKAILSFADILGISQDQFHATMDQYRINSQQNDQNGQTEEY